MRTRVALHARVAIPAGRILPLICIAALAHGAPPPQIGSISPDTVRAGGPDLVLTVRGSDFQSGATVLSNGNPLSTTFFSPTQLTAILPRAFIDIAGVLEISVSNPDRLASNRVSFTVKGPTIASFSPPPTAGMTAASLTLLGDGFDSGAAVWWTGETPVQHPSVVLPTLLLKPTQITASVPDELIANPATVLVRVINGDGTPSNFAQLTIRPAVPVLSGIDPSGFSPGGPDFPLTVKGYGFLPGTAVLWNGVSLLTHFDSAAQLSATVPANLVASVGTVIVKVRNPNGNVSDFLQANIFLSPPGLYYISSAASYTGPAIAPGEIVGVFYAPAGPNKLMGAELDAQGRLSTTLGALRVTFDDIPAPLVYVSRSQAGAIVPYAVAGRSSTQVQVTFQDQASELVRLPVTDVAPGIFTQDASGHGPGSIRNQDYSLNGADNPAHPGSYIFVYATGEGQTDPAGVDGKLVTQPYPRPLHSVTATVGGIDAEVQYAGGVTGSVAGLMQVNVKVPESVTPGSAVPFVLKVGGVATRPDVTVAIR